MKRTQAQALQDIEEDLSHLTVALERAGAPKSIRDNIVDARKSIEWLKQNTPK